LPFPVVLQFFPLSAVIVCIKSFIVYPASMLINYYGSASFQNVASSDMFPYLMYSNTPHSSVVQGTELPSLSTDRHLVYPLYTSFTPPKRRAVLAKFNVFISYSATGGIFVCSFLHPDCPVWRI